MHRKQRPPWLVLEHGRVSVEHITTGWQVGVAYVSGGLILGFLRYAVIIDCTRKRGTVDKHRT